MNKTVAEATAFAAALKPQLASLTATELLIFPSFFGVRPVADALHGTLVHVGAQDLYVEASGAFTGEVSALQITDAGATHVLVGHSERRHVLHESEALVAKKLAAALAGGLIPMLCVGETLAEREGGRMEAVVTAQLEAALAACAPAAAARVLIAYEPVWAIGTGRNATPDDAAFMHAVIRAWLAARFGGGLGTSARILYGGSVKPDNAGSLCACDGVDGLLVGGASLDAASFTAIARAASAG